MSNTNIADLKPVEVWKNFAALNAVPRPSKKEERVIAFIKEFGENLGLETTVDAVGNVLIKKPATAGMEDRETVVLQSHLDMVCQKNNDTRFDFDTEGIRMMADGDWVRAEGTTLGADNGLGVAAMMGLLESKDIPHPAIEALFTIDEETGMTGAKGLEAGVLTGKIMLNLDTEEDDEIDIGCAGGVDVTATRTFDTEPTNAPCLQVTIRGLQGGHSGMDIHKGFGNANVLLFRILYKINEQQPIQLAEIDGGSLRNAIPREAKAVFAVADAENAQKIFHEIRQELLEEFASLEKDLAIDLQPVSPADTTAALSAVDSKTVIFAVRGAHHGVYRMSPDVPDLVEASNNIARIELKAGQLSIGCLSRSSVESSKDDVASQLRSVFELAGMTVEFSGSYPGWKPKPTSEIVRVMTKIYEEKYGQQPAVVACHAGLECGIIGAKYPEMEMVSFGPTIRGAHSPDERAQISSVQKFWDFLQAVLANTPTK